jgi:2-polyprenyl-3-methyl-5-hydroxy-6-metoxy-1,4-benzoquinol methylase
MTNELDPEGVESRTLLQAADFNNARVLEVGSGDGRLAFRYARRGHRTASQGADLGHGGLPIPPPATC